MPFNKESARLARRVLVGFYLLIAAVPAYGDSLELLKSAGVEAGLVVHLNCGDGTETVRLSANERLLVQGLDDDDAQIQKARHNIRAAGCYGRVSVMKYDGGRLPYVDNLVNVVIADGDFAVSEKEILRVLAPLGVAFVNGRKIVKPWPDNMDEWNHFLHGPDNNAVAADSVIWYTPVDSVGNAPAVGQEPRRACRDERGGIREGTRFFHLRQGSACFHTIFGSVGTGRARRF